MTLVAAYEYRNGKRLGAVGPDRTHSAAHPDGRTFAWVGLVEPTPAEMEAWVERFALHPLAVEDALHAHQLPKLEIYGDQLFVVVRTASLKNGRIVYGETACFVARNFILSVRHGSDQGHSAVRSRLESQPKLLAHGVDYVLHGLIDMVVDNYFPVIDAISDEVELLEQSALESALNGAQTRRLFALRRDLLHLQRMLLPMEDVCAKLANLDLPAIDAHVRPYFRDVLDHVRRVASMAALLRDVLGSVVETSALIEQQRQGQITRTLAAWAAILAVPTAIAGIYGMNFENMPELRQEYGYFVVLAAIALACGALFLHFRRLGWL